MSRDSKIIGALILSALSASVAAHEERPVQFPSGLGSVPVYRTTGPRLVVCAPDTLERVQDYPGALRAFNRRLFAECQDKGFTNIQEAINAVTERGTRILIQPGRYEEQSSLVPPTGQCAEIADKFPLSYEEEQACPHLNNLIAIFGDGPDADIACDNALCNLQLEGTGLRAADVVVDGSFEKLNVIRADRADGVYFRNFTVQRSSFNALYVIETDGFAIDRMLGRWNDEYAFLTFSSDHGLYVDCEAYGNGDAGIYPGSAADLHGVRTAIEVTRCRSHHNLIGFSGTAGNSLFVHDNDFFANTVGINLDSLFPNHPGLPQNSSTIANNRIWGNNEDYYRFYRDGTCFKPIADRGYELGVVCPALGVPIGTGILLAGGNGNVFRSNWIWDNWRFGTVQLWVPAFVRGELDPEKLFDTSHFNRYVRNHMGRSPGGELLPNGVDFWWDEEGEGNCWERNNPGKRTVTSDPANLPTCDPPVPFQPGNLEKQLLFFACIAWSPQNLDPEGCDLFLKPIPPPR